MPSPLGFFGPEFVQEVFPEGSFYHSATMRGGGTPDFDGSVHHRGPRPIDTRPIGSGGIYDPSTINMFLGDDPPIDMRPIDMRPIDMRPIDTRPIGSGGIWDPSKINMFLGDDPAPRPSSQLVWDGSSRGPESLMWLRGEIPDRQGNYNRPTFPGPSKPTEQQLQREYQDYMNSIGNPPTVTNHYFYWRADRLRGDTGGPDTGGPPQLVPPSETFPPLSSGNAYEELAKLTPDVRGGTSFSAGSMMQDQLTAMAHKMTGSTNIVGAYTPPDLAQRLQEAKDTLMAMVQAKMDQGIPFAEAFANVYEEQGSPKTIKRAPEGKPDDGGDDEGYGGYVPPKDRCRDGVCGDPPYCPVTW